MEKAITITTKELRINEAEPLKRMISIGHYGLPISGIGKPGDFLSDLTCTVATNVVKYLQN